MIEVVEPRVVVDRFALLSLLRDGSLESADRSAIRASEQYLVLESEYGSLYRATLASRSSAGYRCAGRIHDVATVMMKPCEYADGWIPVLSPSFLGKVLPVPIVVAQPPPEALGLRVRLLSAVKTLSDAEAALIAGLVWHPHVFVACERDLSQTARELLTEAEIVILDLHHDCPHT